MPSSGPHQCVVSATPWADVYCTHAHSARHYGKHWHDSYGLGLVDHGGQRSASGRGQVDAVAGDVIATNPGEVHDGQPLGHGARTWRMLYFDPGALAPSAGAGAEPLLWPVMRQPPLAAALRLLLHRVACWNAAQPDQALALACDEALAATRAALLRPGAPSMQTAQGGGADASAQRARDLLAAHLDQPPSLQALADTAGLGKYQLLRRFARSYQLTPYAWLRQQRGERARALIRRGLPLCEAAMASGFADQSHMTRTFVQQFGFTPGAWQRALGLA